MLKITTCCLFCFGLTIATVAQRYTFKNYTTHDGLVQTDITDIMQDKRGAIWIGTKGGLSIFEGKQFTNYDDHDVLQSLYINQLFCDSAGTVWIATGNGLLTYDNRFHIFFKAPPGKEGSVNSLTTNNKNQLFFVSGNAVYRVNGNKAEQYPISKGIDNKIDFIAFDRRDNLWIVTNEMRVYKMTSNSLTPIRTPFSEAYAQQGLGVLKILGKQGPSPCFVTNFGSFCVKGDSLCSFVSLHPSFYQARTGAATYVLQDGDSTLWVGGTMGLSKLTSHTTTRFAEANGFCDNSVSCLFTDREKNLWIGCTYNGVYKLANEALFYIKSAPGSFDLRHVSAISELPGQGTLLATWGKGLYLMKQDSVSGIDLPTHMRYITCLLSWEGNTYIGWFGRGLWKMNNQTHQISCVPGFAQEEAVATLYKTGKGFVAQTLGYKGYLLDEAFRVKAVRRFPDGYSLAVANDQIIGIGARGETDILDDHLQPVRKNIFPQISSRITEIIADQNELFVGTFGQGLFVYNTGGELIKRIDKKSGLNTNIVTSLLADGSNLFIGSNLGLLRADLPGVRNVKAFTESEGMFNWECRINGLKKLAGGGMMIATTNGPYLYYPQKDVHTVSVLITVADFCYGPHHIAFPPAAAMHLPQKIAYKNNGIMITLKGISQRNPDDIVYHYRLQDNDTGWIATAHPVIRFEDLAPGNYHFNAYITIGNFVSSPLSITFSVGKPLSGELWFQALLVLALSVLCWLLLTIGNRMYQRYVQSKTLGELEKDIALKQQLTTGSVLLTKEHYDSLRAFLRTSHNNDNTGEFAGSFLRDTSKRIEWLWQKQTVTTSELHQYFDALVSAHGREAKIYHKQSGSEAGLRMTDAFPLLQVFSLYLIANLYRHQAPVFSLDSEIKAAGRLLLRLYILTPVAVQHAGSTYPFFKEAIAKQKAAGVTIDIIENSTFGDMLVAEVNL